MRVEQRKVESQKTEFYSSTSTTKSTETKESTSSSTKILSLTQELDEIRCEGDALSLPLNEKEEDAKIAKAEALAMAALKAAEEAALAAKELAEAKANIMKKMNLFMDKTKASVEQAESSLEKVIAEKAENEKVVKDRTYDVIERLRREEAELAKFEEEEESAESLSDVSEKVENEEEVLKTEEAVGDARSSASEEINKPKEVAADISIPASGKTTEDSAVADKIVDTAHIGSVEKTEDCVDAEEEPVDAEQEEDTKPGEQSEEEEVSSLRKEEEAEAVKLTTEAEIEDVPDSQEKDSALPPKEEAMPVEDSSSKVPLISEENIMVNEQEKEEKQTVVSEETTTQETTQQMDQAETVLDEVPSDEIVKEDAKEEPVIPVEVEEDKIEEKVEEVGTTKIAVASLPVVEMDAFIAESTITCIEQDKHQVVMENERETAFNISPPTVVDEESSKIEQAEIVETSDTKEVEDAVSFPVINDYANNIEASQPEKSEEKENEPTIEKETTENSEAAEREVKDNIVESTEEVAPFDEVQETKTGKEENSEEEPKAGESEAVVTCTPEEQVVENEAVATPAPEASVKDESAENDAVTVPIPAAAEDEEGEPTTAPTSEEADGVKDKPIENETVIAPTPAAAEVEEGELTTAPTPEEAEAVKTEAAIVLPLDAAKVEEGEAVLTPAPEVITPTSEESKVVGDNTAVAPTSEETEAVKIDDVPSTKEHDFNIQEMVEKMTASVCDVLGCLQPTDAVASTEPVKNEEENVTENNNVIVEEDEKPKEVAGESESKDKDDIKCNEQEEKVEDNVKTPEEENGLLGEVESNQEESSPCIDDNTAKNLITEVKEKNDEPTEQGEKAEDSVSLSKEEKPVKDEDTDIVTTAIITEPSDKKINEEAEPSSSSTTDEKLDETSNDLPGSGAKEETIAVSLNEDEEKKADEPISPQPDANEKDAISENIVGSISSKEEVPGEKGTKADENAKMIPDSKDAGNPNCGCLIS